MKVFTKCCSAIIVCIGIAACSNQTNDCQKEALNALPLVESPANPVDPFGACLIAQIPSDTSEAKISCEDLMTASECEAKIQGMNASCTAFQFYKSYNCNTYKDVITIPLLPDQVNN